jgi:hypothetical protein
MGRPAGSRLAAPSEVLAGSALVGQAVLYRWPVEGWVRGTVTGRSRTAGSVLARGAVRPHLRPRGGGVALASESRRGLTRPCGPLGSPPACGALVWLPFSGSTVMGLPADGSRVQRRRHGSRVQSWASLTSSQTDND